jgi:hypothetical protein
MPGEASNKSGLRRSTLLISIALLLLLAVTFFGWYQFDHRASRPINMIREHVSPSGSTIGDSILGFIEGKGVEIVSRGFKPSWGAEEVSDNVFTVSFVYEVGREANWISWKVDMNSGEVAPLDDWAGELWTS